MVTVNVKPVPEVLIKLTDRKYKCSFNMIAMANIQEALGTLEGEEHITNISPAHMCAFVLYAGIKANEDSFTMDEAKALAMQMGPGSYALNQASSSLPYILLFRLETHYNQVLKL